MSKAMLQITSNIAIARCAKCPQIRAH